MDYAYDLIELPIGKDLLIDLILPFVNEKDFVSLRKVYLKPKDEENDEYRDLFVQVITELTEKVMLAYIFRLLIARTKFWSIRKPLGMMCKSIDDIYYVN